MRPVVLLSTIFVGLRADAIFYCQDRKHKAERAFDSIECSGASIRLGDLTEKVIIAVNGSKCEEKVLELYRNRENFDVQRIEISFKRSQCSHSYAKNFTDVDLEKSLLLLGVLDDETVYWSLERQDTILHAPDSKKRTAAESKENDTPAVTVIIILVAVALFVASALVLTPVVLSLVCKRYKKERKATNEHRSIREQSSPLVNHSENRAVPTASNEPLELKSLRATEKMDPGRLDPPEQESQEEERLRFDPSQSTLESLKRNVSQSYPLFYSNPAERKKKKCSSVPSIPTTSIEEVSDVTQKSSKAA